MTSDVLVFDRDEAAHAALRRALSPEGFQIYGALGADHALALVRERFFAAIVVDLDSPRAGAGIQVLQELMLLSPRSVIVGLCPRVSVGVFQQVLSAGAADLVSKDDAGFERLRVRIARGAGEVAVASEMSSLLLSMREALSGFLKLSMEAERHTYELEQQVAAMNSVSQGPEAPLKALFVEGDRRLVEALTRAEHPGLSLSYAASGGEALDRLPAEVFHLILIARELPDMPDSMLLQAARSLQPDALLLSYARGQSVEMVENQRRVTVLDKFTSANQLLEELTDLMSAFRAKSRERRHLERFRERHGPFLRQLAELRARLDRVLPDAPSTTEITPIPALVDLSIGRPP